MEKNIGKCERKNYSNFIDDVEDGWRELQSDINKTKKVRCFKNHLSCKYAKFSGKATFVTLRQVHLRTKSLSEVEDSNSGNYCFFTRTLF